LENRLILFAGFAREDSGCGVEAVGEGVPGGFL